MESNNKALLSVLAAPGVKGKRVTSLSAGNDLKDFILSIVSKKEEQQDPFYVLDLGVLVSVMDKWNRSLPTVRPFYAVKCNPHPALLGALAALEAGFDCGSRAEIETVLELGISPDRIIYANLCKAESHIRYAASVGVNLTTFDSLDEIDKIQRLHPNCELLLRLKVPDDSSARFPLGSKFGALLEEVTPLLQACHAARLVVAGVSFHVGSGALHSRPYHGAIASAKAAFETATKLGMPRMRILDVGGGFTVGSLFNDVTVTIKGALQEYFSNEPGLTIISEPGRFFAESVITLAVQIIGKRVRGKLREYWINDGIFGSFLDVLFDKTAAVRVTPLAWSSNRANPTCEGEKTYTSTVFGPTCDALDRVLTNHQLPELQLNDWLVFHNMGAYSAACGSNFNGFNTSAIPTNLVCSNLS